jgi:putative ABC transport system permease protein
LRTVQGLIRDAAYSWRAWRRTPGALAAALIALALGLGANATVFSIVSGVLLKPLPYADPERLVMVWQDMRARGGPEREWASPGLFVEWQHRATAFEHLAAVRGWMPNLTGTDEPERLRGAAVSHGYFGALGVAPMLGRVFSEDDDRPEAAPVAVVGHALWTRRFGADPTLVGRTILLDGQAVTVIGIMPASFRPPIVDADIFTPIRIDPERAPRGMIVLRVMGKLTPGIPLAQAQAQMSTIAQVLGREDPEWENARVALVPLHDDLVGNVRPVLLVLTAAVALVLLISCANVGSLLLARASDRAREITIRVALGASRWQIVRLLLLESVLLSAVGGLLGLLVASWGVRGLVAIAPAAAPRLQDVALDWPVLLFTAAISVLAAVMSGLVPVLGQTRSPDLNPSLREGGREATSAGRLRSLLVIAEVTLAMTLVVAAALLVQSLISLQRVDLGFNHDRLLTASVAPPRGTYRSEDATRHLLSQLLERSAAIPGVTDAALTTALPLSGTDSDFTFDIDGRPPPRTAADEPQAWFRIVSPNFFQVMGMRIVEGRGLTAEDRTNGPAAVVVTDTLAKRYWPDGTALGARLVVERQEATIVGIVADVRHRGPSSPAQAEMYLSFLQFGARSASLVLRTTVDASRVAAPLRAAVRDVDPQLPLAAIAPMDQLVARSLSQPLFLASVLSGFSGLAALLALVGIYGVMSYTVSRRRREIGVRMALGAERAAVMRLVLRQSLVLVGAGVTAGVVCSVLASRLLGNLLFGVRPGEPATVAVMALLTVIAGIAATYAPARRASRIDPLAALRED